MLGSPLSIPFRDHPIPDQSIAAERRIGFRQHPIDSKDPRYAEPMVEVTQLGLCGRNYYYRADNPPYYQRIPGAIKELSLRKSVASALQKVNADLTAFGLELFIHDAFRPLAVQRYFHDEWMPKVLKQKDHSLSGERLVTEVEKYWARPPTSTAETQSSPSPHFTGAAVDLTLRHIGGDLLEMGGLFDEPSELSHRDYFEKHPPKNISETEARANRRILHWVMESSGFAGHPFEWWHFSLGDQLWAKLTGAAAAYYGPAADFS